MRKKTLFSEYKSNFYLPYLVVLLMKLPVKITINTIITLLFLAMPFAYAAPKTVQSDTVKAAFIYNFIKYITWPNEAGKKELIIGFYGKDSKYYQAVSKMQGKKVRNLVLKTQKISHPNQLNKMDLVILDKKRSKKLSTTADRVLNKSVLMISEQSTDDKNTMINFVVNKDETLTFKLNRYKMLIEKLTVDSDIVVLGGSDIDIASVLKELNQNLAKRATELAIQKKKQLVIEKKLASGKAKIAAQQNKLTQQSNKLAAQNKKLNTQTAKLELQTTKFKLQTTQLATQIEKLDKQTIKLDQQTVKLEEQKKGLQKNNQKLRVLETSNQALKDERTVILNKLSNNQTELGLLQSEIVKKERDISLLANKIDQRKDILEGLHKRQAEQEKIVAEKEAEIASHIVAITEQSSLINTQYSFIMLATAAIIGVLISTVLVYRSNIVKQRMNSQLSRSIDDLKAAHLQLQNTQSQLIESEKMAALGSLVAGVAHEINTPLGVSITAASHLSHLVESFQEKYKSGGLKRSDLESLLQSYTDAALMLMNNLTRAADLIQNFKQISVDQVSEVKREFELTDYLESLMQSLHPQLKQNRHQVEVHSDSEIFLNSYPGLIAQVFSNLVMNSLHHGFKNSREGLIVISLKLDKSTDIDSVLIDYHDNGVGISPEAQSKVFEPFYTTALSSGGSGLGMSISYNIIVQNLQGEIRCVSADEGKQGAHFILNFPLHSVES